MSTTREEEQRAHTAPAVLPPPPASRIGVMIATPKRAYNGPEDLPPAVGRAMRELALRGTPRPPMTGNTDAPLSAIDAWDACQTGNEVADAAFRQQADKYQFEFAAAVGGMCRARNSCVHEFLKTKNSFILWIDDDLDRDPRDGPGTLADMILRLLSHRQPAVGAMYCTRKRRPQWACTFMPGASLDDDRQKDGLLQVAELAGGATLIHRKVFTEVARIFGFEPLREKKPSINYRDRDTAETIVGFYQNCVVNGDLLSEDYWLSYLCRCAQIGLLVDTKVALRHRDASGAVYPEGDFPPIPAYDATNREVVEVPPEKKP